MRIKGVVLLSSLLLILGQFLNTALPAHSVEFGIDATGDPNAVQIQGNTSGFLYSERIILTAAHVLNQLRIQPNGDTDGFVFAPGLADKTNAKRYKIIKAFIPKTFINADYSRNIQPIDDFAIVVINEDLPLKMRVAIATDVQMQSFAQERVKVEMVGYGLQSGSQRNNPQELIRAPYKLSSSLLSPNMIIDHYKQNPNTPNFSNLADWGAKSTLKTGSICNGDSGAGYFVQQENLRLYVGTAGNGNGLGNCGVSYVDPAGGISWFPSPNKFSDLIKSAEIFVEGQKKLELLKAEEVRLAAELRAKQEADAVVAAELKAKQEAEEKVAADKAAAEIKAKQEADAKAAALAAAKKRTTITCVKGKLTKKVTAVNPKCPAGYKKK